MLIAIIVAAVLTPQPHAEMRAWLENSRAQDSNALLQLDAAEVQAIVNAQQRPSSGIELTEVRDVKAIGPDFDVACRLYHPDPETELPLVVWIHGGGWIFGTLDSTDPEARFLAVEAGVAVLSVDYRVAPQDHFPAAVDDCVQAVRWAIDHAEELGIDRRRVAVGGASAGGNLAAVTAQRLNSQHHDPPLAAQFLVYPALDALSDTPSRREFAHGYFLETQHMDWFYDVYAPNHDDWASPLLSPLRAPSLAGLPHAVILPAQLDILRDEAVQYAAELIEDGVGVDLLVAEGMPHGFIAKWMESPAAAAEFRAGIRRLATVLHGEQVDAIDLLDTNMDGWLEPFEAADAIARMTEEYGEDSLAVSQIASSAALSLAWQRQELVDIWNDLDANTDGWLDADEIDDDLRSLAAELDADDDGRLAWLEFNAISRLQGDLFAEMEAAAILAEYDRNDDGGIDRPEAIADPELHDEADTDDDDVVSRDELLAALAKWNASLWFEVEGDEAHAYGTIDGTTPGRVMQLLLDHPAVRTIVLDDVPGSLDDDSNLRACRLIRHHGLATHVPRDGEIASGGVDMFCAGVERTAEPGAMIGVHSWGGVGESGVATPKDHEAHEMYLEYGREMGLPDAFYWFTIEAAGPGDIHWMTPKELDRYGVLTDRESSDTIVGEPSTYEFGVQPLSSNEQSLRREGFVKQAVVTAPNGRPIRIIAQENVRDIVVARARNLLQFFLTDVPGSKYGADKAAVANAMADNGAILMIPTGAHRPGHEPEVEAQPLFVDETPVDGSQWYLANDWDHRDAAFEEIFHLVHDTGIGTYLKGALPEYQDELDREARQAIQDGRWGIPIDPGVQGWLDELEQEDSLAQEYIASVIDSYYGLWDAFDERPGGMWGIYVAKNRSEIDSMDPRGRELIDAFLPQMMHGYEALVDPSFAGDFLMAFDPAIPYTHKSRYYVDATLTGDKNSGLRGNASDNTLHGNQGNNTIRGGEGQDTAVFSGERSQYELVREGDFLVVRDTVANRDGTDRIESIERIRFGNGEIVHIRVRPDE
ncbi:MAG: alpha/beta hydrolase fold domain-containing protein [Planctomycetes bacterium]|nr:alpha/beta hydrolase fold domain-containing protein [Planctomycetota bacterium]MCP4839414.1 alpha/beta hydrolase fold domain-containing protein [Planctomycetota bacterium]